MTQTVLQPPTELRRLIDDRGIRHVFIAERLGVTRSHFTRLLNRERAITPQAVEKLSALLGVPVGVFFDGSELILKSQTSTNESPAGVQATERGHVVEREGDAIAEGVYPLDAADAGLVPPAVEFEGTRGE